MALTKEEKQLLKIYNKTEDEKIKEVLGKLLEEDDEQEEIEEVEETEEVVEEVEEEEPEEKVEEKEFDFEKELKALNQQWEEKLKVVVDEVKTLKKQKGVGIKAKPKEPSEKWDFDAMFEDLQAKQHQS